MRRAQGRLRNGADLTAAATAIPLLHCRQQRSRYQRGLIDWLKRAPGGAREMRAAVAAIDPAQLSDAQQEMWRAALAFFDALATPPERADDAARAGATPLCVRVEKQFRALAEGASSDAGALEIELRRWLARRSLAQASGAWSKFATDNDSPALIEFQGATARFDEHAASLCDRSLARLAAELAELATWLSFHAAAMSEAIALEVTTALLLLEDVLSRDAAPGAEFAQHADFMCERLRDCVRGKLLRTAPSLPFLEQLSRQAEERLLHTEVADPGADGRTPTQIT